MAIQFRPHHFLCALGYQGKGYSPEFVQNFDRLAEKIHGDGSTPIETVQQTDSICAPCPNRRERLCTEELKIQTLDQNHLEAHGMKAPMTLTWNEAKKRIKETISIETFHRICSPCSWKALGYCEDALKKLHAIGLLFGLIFISSLSPAAHAESKAMWNTLTKIDSALAKNEVSKLNTILSNAATSEGFQELFLYLKADASVRQMMDLMRIKKTIPKKERIETVRKHLHEIESEWPDSPFLKSFPNLYAFLDFFEGEDAKRQKKWTLSVERFERGFYRLFQATQASRIPMWALTSYAKSCEKEDCEDWAEKLQNFYFKEAPEAKIVKAIKSDPLRAEGGARLTAPYKAPDLDQQAFDLILADVDAKKPDAVLESSKAFLEKFPKSTHRQRIRVYMAQAHESKNETEAAKALYVQVLKESPLSYYGLLASMALKVPVESAIESKIPETKGTLGGLSPWEKFRIEKSRQLSEKNLHTLAALYIKDFKPRENMSSTLLYELTRTLSNGKKHLAALTILTEIIQRGSSEAWSSEAVRMVFPQEEYARIKPIAEDIGLDPILALSLIKQESAFEPDSVSSSGALGFMQLMPFTAIEVEAGIPLAEVLIPERNIALGTKYLAGLLKKFNGNVAKSLAAYNAGPNAVDRWVREGRAEGGLLSFVEHIPYKETRDYVGSIMRNYYWYSSRILGEKIENLDRFWQTIPNAMPSSTTQPLPASATENPNPLPSPLLAP